jgi:hypothetical protein
VLFSGQWISTLNANTAVELLPTFVSNTPAVQALWTVSNAVRAAGHFRLMTDTSGQIQAKALAGGGSLTIFTMGWKDTRGKDG